MGNLARNRKTVKNTQRIESSTEILKNEHCEKWSHFSKHRTEQNCGIGGESGGNVKKRKRKEKAGETRVVP